jgi:predicted transcriptional regulator
MVADFSDSQAGFDSFIRELFINQTKHALMSPDELVHLYQELVLKFTPVFNPPDKVTGLDLRSDISRSVGGQQNASYDLRNSELISELVKYRPELKNMPTKQYQALTRIHAVNVDVPEKVKMLGIIAVLGFKSLHSYPDRIFCLECGLEMKVMSKRHLGFHSLSPNEYRDRWKILPNTPIMSEETVMSRKPRPKDISSDEAQTENQDQVPLFSEEPNIQSSS